MSSPYDRLIDDEDLETMHAYAELVLGQLDEASRLHVAQLAQIVCVLYRHIRAREEIGVLEMVVRIP
jgi:hypothetical protein